MVLGKVDELFSFFVWLNRSDSHKNKRQVTLLSLKLVRTPSAFLSLRPPSPVCRCTPRYHQVPVLASFPSPLVPATATGRDSNRDGRSGGTAISIPGQGQVRNGVVSPSRVRLREDMWVSSRTFYVLDAEVRTDRIGWGVCSRGIGGA